MIKRIPKSHKHILRVYVVIAKSQNNSTDKVLATVLFATTLTTNRRSSGNCHDVCLRWVCVDVVR